MNWIEKQIEWVKEFFVEDKHPSSPSHKNLIGISLIAVFCVAFIKKIAISVDIPDIPVGWQLVILGLLGIRSIQSIIEKKISNGNGHAPKGTTET